MGCDAKFKRVTLKFNNETKRVKVGVVAAQQEAIIPKPTSISWTIETDDALLALDMAIQSARSLVNMTELKVKSVDVEGTYGD